MNYPDIRDQVKEGDEVCAIWFDDPNWYRGKVVMGDDGKLGVQCDHWTWGTIEGASKVVWSKDMEVEIDEKN